MFKVWAGVFLILSALVLLAFFVSPVVVGVILALAFVSLLITDLIVSEYE